MPVTVTGDNSQYQGQVGAGLEHFHPPDHVGEYVLVPHLQAAVAVQHREQHGQAVLFQPHSDPPGITQLAVVHQGLDLHQQGPGALPYHHHSTAGGGLVAAVEENSRGIFHFLHALLGHGEYPQLIDRAEAVFLAAQGAEARVVGALQQDGAVDHVLQHLGARQ